MASDSLDGRAQLDNEEREYLEDIVAEMRERVEGNTAFRASQYASTTNSGNRSVLDESGIRASLIE